MRPSTSERGVFRKFEGFPGVIVQDSCHLHIFMNHEYKELSGGSCQVYLTRRRSSEIDSSQIDGDHMSIIDCHQSDDLSRLSSR